jgi:hypothetical protein
LQKKQKARNLRAFCFFASGIGDREMGILVVDTRVFSNGEFAGH